MAHIINPRLEAREARALELLKRRKWDLVQLHRDTTNTIWTAAPVSSWTKEEIVSGIVEAEFGAAYMCGEKDASGARCSIGAGTIHGDHRFTIGADVAVKELSEQ